LRSSAASHHFVWYLLLPWQSDWARGKTIA